MQISSMVNNAAQVTAQASSGDRPTAHVLGVSVIGQSITQVVLWIIELQHIAPPDAQTQIAIGVLASCAISWIGQKLG